MNLKGLPRGTRRFGKGWRFTQRRYGVYTGRGVRIRVDVNRYVPTPDLIYWARGRGWSTIVLSDDDSF